MTPSRYAAMTAAPKSICFLPLEAKQELMQEAIQELVGEVIQELMGEVKVVQELMGELIRELMRNLIRSPQARPERPEAV
jgi:hypothetical protein